MGSNRLLSLDVFRGLTIAAMILVNNPGSWSNVYSPLLHAEWHGCTPTDLVFPFFLFIVGVAITFSLNRVREDKENHSKVTFKIFKRAAILFLIGLFINGFPYFELSTLRIPGVLQRIAIVFFVCAWLFLKTKWKSQVYLGISVLVIYWLIFALIPVTDTGIPSLEKGQNIAAWVDQQLLSGHMWQVTKTWDPEGILSTLPAVVTCLLGILTGIWLKTDRNDTEKIMYLFIAANSLVVTGLIWDLTFPINKSLWTSSYVLYTGGIAIHFLAMLYWILDVKKSYFKMFEVFRVFGINPLFIYALSMLLAIALYEIPLTVNRESISLQAWLYHQLLTVFHAPTFTSLLYALLFILTMYAVAWALNKRNIIIKV